jgi:hypothetical protein
MSVSDLVGEIDTLRARTRRAAGSGAVPVALLGLLVAFAAPLYAATREPTGLGFGEYTLGQSYQRPMFVTRFLRIDPGTPAEDRLAVYWLVGVPVAFLLVAAYYAWRARRTGISLDGWRVALAGGVVLAALLLAVELPAHGLPAEYRPNRLLLGNFVNPLLVVVVGAFAVAWVERSRVLGAMATVFLAGVVTFDVRVLADQASGAWGNLQSAGPATLVLAAWLLLAAAVVGAAGVVRPRRG